MADPSSFSSSPQYFVVADTSASRLIFMADPSLSSPPRLMAGPSSPSSSSSSSSSSPSSPPSPPPPPAAAFAAAEEQEQDQVQDVAALPDWASLQNELLALIVGNVRHGLDYVSFRSVCTNWLSVAPIVSFPPMLLLAFQPETGMIPFFNPSDREIHLFPYTGARGAVLAGCTGRWLTLVQHSGRMSMMNPFTGDVVQLPSATDGIAVHSNMPFSMSGLYRVSPEGLGSFKLERVWKTFVEDVALSCDPYAANGGCTIMLTLACSNRVAFCRVGTDAAWTVLNTGLVGPVRAVRHCDGRFFIVDWNGEMVACEIPAEGAPGNATVTPMASLRTTYGFHDTKLLEHKGELFMVVCSRFAHLRGSITNPARTRRVFKSDLQGIEPTWTRVPDMGDCTLFVTLQCNSCYIGRNLMGCRQNSIYFSDHDPYEPYYDQAHNLKVAHIGNGTSSTLCTNYVDRRSMKVAVWMKPSLRRPRN